MNFYSIVKIVCLIFLFVNVKTQVAQSQQTKNQFQITENINSTFLNEERNMTIHLPSSYFENKEQKYPVLYVLDGENLMLSTKPVYDFLSEKKHIPEMIIVSIPHTGKRSRDYYTYFRDTGKENKGADYFLSFIELEVMKLVNEKYKTTAYNMISGHSRSGLFVIHSLIKRPELFRARFAFSASSHHIPKQRALLKRFLQNNHNLNGYFYMNVGGTEFYKIQDAYKELKQLFANSAPEGLRYDIDIHEVDGHQTSPFIGQYTAFKRLYAPLKLGHQYEHMSYDEVTAHFKTITREFGYEVKPRDEELFSMMNYYLKYEPDIAVLHNLVRLFKKYYPNSTQLTSEINFYENWLSYGIKESYSFYQKINPSQKLLNELGYSYLSQEKSEEAFYLFNLAIEMYPTFANPFDSLAEAYEKTGKLKKALKYYKKAYHLAVKNEESQKRIDYYLSNMERVQNSL